MDAFLGLDGFLPYDMMVFEDQLYLDPRFHEPARVVSIDGHSGSEIVTALRQTVVSDSVTPSTTDGALDRTFSNLYAKHYGLSDSYEVVLDRGEPVRTSVAGGSYDDVPYIGDPLPNATSLEGGVLTVTLNEIMPGKEWRAFTRAIRRGLREAQGVVLDLRDCGGGFAPTPEGYSNTKALGSVLYTEHVYAFEIAAVILLLAIIAAITLTMRKRPGLKVQDISKQVAVRAKDRIRVVKMDAEKKQ